MKPFLTTLALAIGCVLALPAASEDLIVSRSAIKDASGTLTIADVARREGNPARPTFNAGVTDSVYWMRLKVRAPVHGHEVVLFILPPYLNEVRLYEADAGDPMRWKTRVTGSCYPYCQRDRAVMSLGFVVNVAAPQATYYLRIKTKSTFTLSVQALEPRDADRKDHGRDLVAVFFVTSMLFLLIWAIHSYLLDGEPVAGLFAAHQAAYTLFGITVTGYLAPFGPSGLPQAVDRLGAILYLAINFTCLLFVREVFKPYRPPAALWRGLNLLLWTFPLFVAAWAMGYNTFAIGGNEVLTKVSWVYFIVTAFLLRAESKPSRRALQVILGSILLNNLAFWMAAQNGWIASKMAVGGMQVLVGDGLVIGGLFALIVHARSRQALREAQQATLDLVLLKQRLEIERKLKAGIERQAQTDYLTGLCNRRRTVELAEKELQRAIRFSQPLTLLMIDIDHFKAINDKWGHSAGDQVLQSVSSLLRDALRDVDIVGRTGGEEFAAVLIETEGDGAFAIAERLCKVVSDATIVAEGTAARVSVTISIGLAQLNGRSLDLNALLREADRALYRAKQAGRNRTCASEPVAAEV